MPFLSRHLDVPHRRAVLGNYLRRSVRDERAARRPAQRRHRHGRARPVLAAPRLDLPVNDTPAPIHSWIVPSLGRARIPPSVPRQQVMIEMVPLRTVKQVRVVLLLLLLSAILFRGSAVDRTA